MNETCSSSYMYMYMYVHGDVIKQWETAQDQVWKDWESGANVHGNVDKTVSIVKVSAQY